MSIVYKETGVVAGALLALLIGSGWAPSVDAQNPVELSDQQVENIVRRSYPYVAMYNVNNKFALKQGGWNTLAVDTALKDHTMREIARPNNDTLYISGLLDLRHDPVVIEVPAFVSDYVSLMVTGYDHYVNIPMSSRLGDFRRPERLLLYTARTEGYGGGPVEGVDRALECSGDLVSAVLRVMPHANEPSRFEKITEQMKAVKMVPLTVYRGGKAKLIDDIEFPMVGQTDFDVFGNNLLEVMQFVFNHTTWDPKNELDRLVLAAYEPLGIVPGKDWDAAHAARVDGARFRKVAEGIAQVELARAGDPAFDDYTKHLFRPKGQMAFEHLLFQSVIGPIGLPLAEAAYPAIKTADGEPMNAMHDYVIRMSRAELPPATAFWSFTLYDMQNGFFVPNDRKKYSVGRNAGMQLNDEGGIEIYVAAQRPDGVPEDNWLPIERKDEPLGVILRIYVPDLAKLESWKAPLAERFGPTPEESTGL